MLKGAPWSIGFIVAIFCIAIFFIINFIYKDNLQDKEDNLKLTEKKLKIAEDKNKDLEDQLINANLKTEASNKKDFILTPKQIEYKVWNWLIDYEYDIQKLKNENFYFQYFVLTKEGKAIIISLPKSKKANLVFFAKLIPSDEEQKKISKWSQKKLNDLLVKIKVHLANKEFNFTVNPNLNEIEFYRLLFVESLTKANFSKNLMLLKAAHTMIATYFHESFIIIP